MFSIDGMQRTQQDRLAAELIADPNRVFGDDVVVELVDFERTLECALRGHECDARTRSRLRAHALTIAARRYLEADASERAAGVLAFAPTCLEDLYLARRCVQRERDDEAWVLFARRFTKGLLRIAGSLGQRDTDEAVSTFMADLWVLRRNGRSLLDTYSGLAPLEHWLALVFRRRLLATRRRETFVSLQLGSDDPTAIWSGSETEYEECRALSTKLIADVLSGLNPRDRDIVESRTLTGERGTTTAQRIGVSPAYVSMRFRELRETLKRRISTMLAHHGLEPEDYL